MWSVRIGQERRGVTQGGGWARTERQWTAQRLRCEKGNWFLNVLRVLAV